MQYLSYNDLVKTIITSVVWEDNPELLNALINIFSEPFSRELELAKEELRLFDANNLYVFEIRTRIEKILKDKPELNNQEWDDLIQKVMLRLATASFEDDVVPGDVKYSIAESELHRLEGLELARIDPDSVNRYREYLHKQLERFKNSNSGKSFPELVKSQISSNSSIYIFDLNHLRKIDEQLRPEFISEESLHLVPMCFIERWKKNTPAINWLKDQKLLIYLFYKLNGWEIQIPGGNLPKFISKTFLVKGEKIKERNIASLLSKVRKKMNSPDSERIDLFLKSIGLE